MGLDFSAVFFGMSVYINLFLTSFCFCHIKHLLSDFLLGIKDCWVLVPRFRESVK